MKVFSRRKDDPRKVWDEDARDDKESLIIPACDLWQEGSAENSETEIDSKSDDNSSGHVTEQSAQDSERSADTSSQCWTFMGARGGCGTTTLAVETAFYLAREHYGVRSQPSRKGTEQVCLIDLDFETGSAIHHLDIEPGLRIEDLSEDISRIDADLTRSFMSYHKSGIAVLATPNVIGSNSRINPFAVVKILEAACEMFPHVILDLPVQWQAWSLAALGGSDFVGLLSETTIPSLYSARSKRAQIGKMLESEQACDIILGKYERRALGNNLRLPDARKALQCEIFATICNDPQHVSEAINCGEPVGHTRKSSRYSKDCRKLIEDIFTRTTLSQKAVA